MPSFRTLACLALCALAAIGTSVEAKKGTSGDSSEELPLKQRLQLVKKSELRAFLERNNAPCDNCTTRQDLVEAAMKFDVSELLGDGDKSSNSTAGATKDKSGKAKKQRESKDSAAKIGESNENPEAEGGAHGAVAEEPASSDAAGKSKKSKKSGSSKSKTAAAEKSDADTAASVDHVGEASVSSEAAQSEHANPVMHEPAPEQPVQTE